MIIQNKHDHITHVGKHGISILFSGYVGLAYFFLFVKCSQGYGVWDGCHCIIEGSSFYMCATHGKKKQNISHTIVFTILTFLNTQ